MYNNNTLKILVIGPQGCGKTAITNYLCDKSNVLDSPYRPTAGVRIIETQKQVKNKRVTIEFWDVSGNSQKYDRCWPAVQKGAHGIIIVYNADNPQSEAEVEFWVDKFPKALHIPTTQCVGFAHHLTEKTKDKKAKQPKGATSLKIVDTNIEDGAETILPAFDMFLVSLMQSLSERQEKEESNLMNS